MSEATGTTGNGVIATVEVPMTPEQIRAHDATLLGNLTKSAKRAEKTAGQFMVDIIALGNDVQALHDAETWTREKDADGKPYTSEKAFFGALFSEGAIPNLRAVARREVIALLTNDEGELTVGVNALGALFGVNAAQVSRDRKAIEGNKPAGPVISDDELDAVAANAYAIAESAAAAAGADAETAAKTAAHAAEQARVAAKQGAEQKVTESAEQVAEAEQKKATDKAYKQFLSAVAGVRNVDAHLSQEQIGEVIALSSALASELGKLVTVKADGEAVAKAREAAPKPGQSGTRARGKRTA